MKCLAYFLYIFVLQIIADFFQVNAKQKDSQASVKYEWCPDVVCPTRGVYQHDLCEQKWLFIISTGRSGSTSLLESINKMGRNFTRLRGEHHGMLQHFIDLEKSALSSGVRSNESRMRTDLFYYYVQQFIAGINPENKDLEPRNVHLVNSSDEIMPFNHDRAKILGFKEIRYKDKEQILFMRRAFPCSRIILNYRENIGSQLQSGYFKEAKGGYKKEVILRLKETEIYFKELTKFYPKTIFSLKLEEFTVGKFNEILQWLNVSGCKFIRICHSNKGSTYQNCEQMSTILQDEVNLVRGSCYIDPHLQMRIS